MVTSVPGDIGTTPAVFLLKKLCIQILKVSPSMRSQSSYAKHILQRAFTGNVMVYPFQEPRMTLEVAKFCQTVEHTETSDRCL